MNDRDRTANYEPETAEAPGEPCPPPALPLSVGRYRVTRLLGEGGFGLVYLARDDQLQRFVAVKVPHRLLVDRAEDGEAYLAEARTVAGLDHPNIVPVYDAGSTADCPCFVVSKFIEGNTLADRIRDGRPPVRQAAEWVAAVADALHHAHVKGLVHRDVKPGNILLDAAGKPYVVDFGLALKEEDVGRGPRYAGTPSYMSPEQARGEGHRVDGRSDVFSLGVVLYEVLTGRTPFPADSRAKLLEQITTLEPRPLRQVDASVPGELERICSKALAKRASERYRTAKDMADDLRFFLADPDAGLTSGRGVAAEASGPTRAGGPPSTPAPSGPNDTLSSGVRSGRSVLAAVVPKGLRSFDARDADFFLELLPGPRDREGLPDGVRFWKTRVEETDPDNTFAVGLVYGPSGCGKSSLVKAGLLPRLGGHVLPVYVEATAQETEARLLNGLRKRSLDLPADGGLKETVTALRRGQGLPPGKKVLIVLDQFEQWLHAHKPEDHGELVQALRQCDGGRVQCVVMVRDDFWLAVSRFLRELETRLLEGQNSSLVDLFDRDHARKVLAAFGRAFGKLPQDAGETSKEQREFLKEAVAGLAREGKVICVRLALLAEMMKARPWTPATLREVGGTEGVGVTFLEETFAAATAPPLHRYHQAAARAVLKALLPESGTDIKGHMLSDAELLAASGYANRPAEFEDLIRILDREVRLITPTDPEGKVEDKDESKVSAVRPASFARYYQLTHDYLVPALRDWLTRKQKETRRGRAELKLAERATHWAGKPEYRRLPGWWEWASIRLLTRRANWADPERSMMRQAGRYHAVRALALLLLLGAATAAGLALRGQAVEQNRRTHAEGLVQRLLDANTSQVPGIVAELEPYRAWADPPLREHRDRAADGSRHQLHTSLALLPVDPGQKGYLYERLLTAEPHEVPVLRDALFPDREGLLERLWRDAEQPPEGREPQRLRAACALAGYDPDGPRWDRCGGAVVQDLVSVNPVYLGLWIDGFRPVKAKLLKPLAAIFRDRRADRTAERTLATNILADYAADQPELLADLLMDADAKQFAVLYPPLANQRLRALPELLAELARGQPPGAAADAKERLAGRRANAAVALARLDRAADVWPLFRHAVDPTVRSHLVDRFRALGGDARAVARWLAEEPDVTARRALLLSLGEFEAGSLPPSEREALTAEAVRTYRDDPDPGLHAAAEWLLRQWKQHDKLREIDRLLREDHPRLDRVRQALSGVDRRPQWFVNGQGQTMAVLPGPVEFLMGSPPGEAGRTPNEASHRRRIGRTFAIATKPVTLGQYLLCRKDHEYLPQYAPTPDCPVIHVRWYVAVEYCNWLSRQEGIPESEWCYRPGPDGKYDTGMALAPDYLKRTGYRLPSEAEWEYACRAGAVTSRYYGDSEELLGKYAWCMNNSANRSWPVGGLKPNDFGLFDMNGNVWQWCQERYRPDIVGPGGQTVEDEEDAAGVSPEDQRVLRGGSFINQSVYARSASRNGIVPTFRFFSTGFRVVRTFR